MRFWYFIGMITMGFVCMRYNKWIRDNTGPIDIAEKIFGQGGTYTFWTFFGAASILASFWFLFGKY
jgi:hypothetical protein